MRKTPLNYADYLATVPEGELPLRTVIRADGNHRAACQCRPNLMQPAIVIVDCRHINKAIVVQDWACPACWSAWIRSSGAKENLYKLVKNGQGNGTLRSEVAKATAFARYPNKAKMQNALVEAKDNGELSMTAPELHCFTRTQWFLMHGIENPERYKSTKFDFIP